MAAAAEVSPRRTVVEALPDEVGTTELCVVSAVVLEGGPSGPSA